MHEFFVIAKLTYGWLEFGADNGGDFTESKEAKQVQG